MSHQSTLPFETVTAVAPETLTEPHLLICEGPDDQAFLSSFIAERQIAGIQLIKHANGRNGFEQRLIEIEAGSIENVQGLLLVVDNDSQPTENFQSVRKQVRRTGLYGVPTERGQFARKVNRPALGIVTLPGNKKVFGAKRGNLETLLLQILELRDEFSERVEAAQIFVNATVPDWSPGAQAKVKLRCLLATNRKRFPLTRVSEMWQTGKGFLEILKDPSLDELDDFLQEFAKL